MNLPSSGRIILLGCGVVSRCLQALLLKYDELDPARVLLIDAFAQDGKDNPLLGAGASFQQFRLSPDNYREFLADTVKPGDVLINLSSGVDTVDVLEWSYANNVLYLDTSVEVWRSEIIDPLHDTIFMRYTRLCKRLVRGRAGGPTAVLEHGANPGLVSHWLKYGLEQIASEMPDADIQQAVRSEDYARLAMLTGTKVVHVSEYDRQELPSSRNPAEFLNTWSGEGLREESSAFAECSWGTHEHSLPLRALQMNHDNLCHLCIKRKAMNSPMRSWVPNEEMIGMMIPHGETFTIGNRLSVWEGGQLIYRPTVCFVYRPSVPALQSLYEFANNGIGSTTDHVMTSEITDGSDDLGVLLMGAFGAVWVGNRLSIASTREVVGSQHNATVLQVAASLLSAFFWALENPRRGLLLPGDLPFQFVLPIVHKYIGELEVHWTDWRPQTDRGDKFSWQFADFSLNNEEQAELVSLLDLNLFNGVSAK